MVMSARSFVFEAVFAKVISLFDKDISLFLKDTSLLFFLSFTGFYLLDDCKTGSEYLSNYYLVSDLPTI